MTTMRRGRAAVAVGAALCLAPSAHAAGPDVLRLAQDPDNKIAFSLRDAAGDVRQALRRGAAPRGNALVDVTRDGRMAVAVHGRGPVSAAQEAALAALGARITGRLPREGAVSVRGRRVALPKAGLVELTIPADRLGAAARLPWVAAVTAIGRGEPDVGDVQSEGVALHRADVQQARGVDGTGVEVGVISDGVGGLATAQGSDDLPDDVDVLEAGSGAEGTAMLEIVHDVAPGADLTFHTTGNGTTEHIEAQNDLVGAGVHVLTEDIAYDAEPAFQRGLVAENGDNIAAAGVPVHSSAGNLGARHAARMPATGTGTTPDGADFSGGTPTGCGDTPDNAVAIAPGGDTTFDFQSSTNGSVTLQWSEPRSIYPTAGRGGFTNLDLYIFRADMSACVAVSRNVQAFGIGDTLETVALNAGTYKAVVDVAGTTAGAAVPVLDLRMRRTTSTDTPTRAGSLNPDSNYLGAATSSAAIDARPGGGLEPFSAAGPVRVQLTAQCANGLVPCTETEAGPDQGTAGPDWTAADAVAVTGAGGFGSPFFGTSAAAPHAAACDALIRDELDQPAAPVATTDTRLRERAEPLGAGVDVEGVGVLDCGPLNQPPTADAGGPYTTPEGTDVALAGTAADPDPGDVLTVEWDLDADGQFDDATGTTPAFDRVGRDGTATVAVRVTDQAGATAQDTAEVTVTNVAPTTAASASGPLDEGEAVTVDGTVQDAGWLDPLTATVDFGDGTGASPLGGTLEDDRPLATLALQASRTFGDDGAFTARLCGTDDDAATDCADAPFTVRNVAPSTTLTTPGATLVDGAVLAQAGTPVTFRGRTQDPGSDDLTTTWDWDDGGLSPDVVATSLAGVGADPDPSPSVGPRDETDERAHTFVAACSHLVRFAARDDDDGADAETVRVLALGTATKRRSEGWWHKQAARTGLTSRTAEEVLCRLAISAVLSDVFNEARSAATLAEAAAVLQPDPSASPLRQLDRELLTAWLNVADGSLPYATAAPVLADAEAVRLDPASTEAQVLAADEQVHALSH